MECSEFLSRFSEFYDQDPELRGRAAFEAHLEACRSCQRYLEVVERGSRLLRDLPFPELRDDFHPRLQHRLFHIDESDPLRGGTTGSGMTVGTALAVATLLVFAAWYPAFQPPPPAVELPPIVVEAPLERAPSSRPAPSRELFFASPRTFHEGSLWTQSNVLLYEHSALGQRHRDQNVIRAGWP